MREWAGKRSRFKTEVARRVQVVRMRSNQTTTPNLTEESELNATFHQVRVNEVIREGRNYLGQELNREKLNT